MLNLTIPDNDIQLQPRIIVIGVGGAGGNAVNNMIRANLEGVEFLVSNTDAQALRMSAADRTLQLGNDITQGLGAGSRPDIGRAAAEEAIEQVDGYLDGCNMAFITAGMGGGTGTGAAPVIARAAKERGILTVGVVTKPFHFEGAHRMKVAEAGLEELQQFVDTLIVIPNQNLFRIATEKTTFADAFKMADEVLHSGVRGVTDLMVMPGLINLDFADIRTVMQEMGKAMMGTGDAEGERRAVQSAEAAISNPLLDDVSMKGARGVLVNITGGMDMTLYEVDEATNRIKEEVDPDANIIFGSTFNQEMDGKIRVSVVATGIEQAASAAPVRTIGSSLTDARATDPRQPQQQPRRQGAPAPAVMPLRPTAANAARPASVVPMQPRPDGMRPVASGGTAPTASTRPAFPFVGKPMRSAAAVAQAQQAQYGEAQAVAQPQAMDEEDPLILDTTAEVQDGMAPTLTEGTAIDDRAPYQHDLVDLAEPAAAPRAPAIAAPAEQPVGSTKQSRFGGLFSRMTRHRDGDHAAAPPQTAETTPEPTPQPAPSKLSEVDLGTRSALPKHEDDSLDIPAFLRRQAN